MGRRSGDQFLEEECSEVVIVKMSSPQDVVSRPWTSDATKSSAARLSAIIIGLGLLALAFVVLGLAGSAAFFSAWILAAGLGRAFRGLRGSAAWAGGIVGTFGLVLAGSAVLRSVSPREHGMAANMAVILVPAFLGLCLLLYAVRHGVNGPRYSRSYSLVPAVISTGFLTVAGGVGALGKYRDIVWAMSGDARNHVSITRRILAGGGVDISTFADYPAGVNAFAAVLAGAGDRSGSVGTVMLNDVRAMASTYVLAAIAIGVLIAAALLELRRLDLRHGSRISWPLFGTLLVASASAGTAFMLGTALDDGFLSAYGALPVSIAAVVFGLRYFSNRLGGLMPFLFLGVTVPLAFVCWTMIAVVPAAILTSAILAATNDSLKSRAHWFNSRSDAPIELMCVGWRLAIAAGATGLISIVCVVALHLPKLEERFILSGSSKIPYSMMIVVLLLVAVSVAFASRASVISLQMIVPIAAGIAGGVVVLWLVGLPGPGITWTYYALKTNWLVSGSLVWVLFVPIVLWAESESFPASVRDRSGVGAISVSIAVLMLSGSATTAQAPVVAAARGWVQPSADVVQRAVDGADSDDPFIFWDWSDHGNDRLGNFWGALAWGSDAGGDFLDMPGIPGGVRAWAYMEMGETHELCELILEAPGMVVYTRNSDLQGELAASCSAGDMTVLLED